MNQEKSIDARTIPALALDDQGELLPPSQVPLEALINPAEIERFAESVAELTQMECSVLLYDPECPRPLRESGCIQIVRAPICGALNSVEAGGTAQCILDVHAAAHEALAAGEPVRANCIGGDGTLYACPVLLHYGERVYPKAAVVAAAEDIWHFHFADRLAEVLAWRVQDAEELMCESDKRCLNAAQLRRLRSIIAGQAASFSGQISERYAELGSLLRYLAQGEEVRRAYSELDAECRHVGRIQRSLVPQSAPEIPRFAVSSHYETARRAGGDYFDFFRQPDGSWGAMIADVSGHGADAAVVMAMLRTVLHTLCAPLPRPADVLAEANQYLCELAASGSFVTAFFAVISTEGDRLCYASAGHNPPLLFDTSTGGVRPLRGEGGFPLGVICDAGFQQSDVALQSGDVLLLYTDGITEAFNPARETFGAERLEQVVSASAPSGAVAVRDAVIESVADFASGEPVHDDQTLVVLERL